MFVGGTNVCSVEYNSLLYSILISVESGREAQSTFVVHGRTRNVIQFDNEGGHSLVTMRVKR